MSFCCGRCEEKGLRCFVDTATGRCAGCIAVKATCSLFVLEEDWEKVQLEKRAKELEVAYAEERQALAAAETARLRRELLEVASRERSFADRDHAILSLQDRSKEWIEGNPAPGMEPFAPELLLPEPSADLGWLQADSSSFLDPSLGPASSFDLSSFLGFLDTLSLDFVGGSPSLILCSS
jgi:hypothetical protein